MPTRGGAAIERPTSVRARAAMLADALDALGEHGLSGLTLPDLAGRAGGRSDEPAAHFETQDEFFQALGEAMAAEARTVPAAPAGGGGWRDLLHRHAVNARCAMRARRDGGLLFARLAVMPDVDGAGFDLCERLCEAGFSLFDAQAAVQLIERFAIGWVITEQAQPARAEDEALAEYEGQLETLLAGITVTRAWGGSAAKHRKFQASLWVFLRNARDSANIAFARADSIHELDRRILLLLQAQGDMTLAAVSTANGVDKAQVSRAIKRLEHESLVERAGIRSPLKLSACGRQIAERMVRLAELRNRELTFGIPDDQLVQLFAVLDILLGRAMSLYDQERRLATAAQGRDAEVDFPDHREMDIAPDAGQVPVDRSRILPPFITLCSYMMRAGALGYKRKTGLSNFDTWVLVEVCRDPPISWPQLVLALYRDQSQAGRTVKRLMEIGLVTRSGKPGRRHGFFAPTPEGERIAAIINGMAASRSEYLFQGIPTAQLNGFMAAFDVLSRNAEVQLGREKAMQEMDRP